MSACGNWQKYQSKNPLQRLLINRFLDTVVDVTTSLAFTTVLDAGSGEGFVSQRLLCANPRIQVTGVDTDKEALKRGRKVHPDITFESGNVTALPFEDNRFDLVICNEVLEHLERPEQAMAELGRVSRHYCLISVPHEPFFRLMNLMRGKSIRRFGNDADHRHLWSARQFQRSLAGHFSLLESRYPLPWQVYLAERFSSGS